MPILTLHTTIDLQTKFEEYPTKNGIFCLWAHQPSNIYANSYSACYDMPTIQIWSKWDKNSISALGPAWAYLGLPNRLMDNQNWQILLQILTLHATIGLHTKFQANWTKKCIFSLWPICTQLGLPNRPKNIQNQQISMQNHTLHTAIGLQTKFQANWMKNGIFIPWAHLGPGIFKIGKYLCRFLLCTLW